MSRSIPGSEPRQVLTVSELNQAGRSLLEEQIGQVWVEGEISNLAVPASGHWYFTLKDAAAQVRCAMFRNRNFLLRQRPKNGQQVLLQATASLYVNRGEYQLIVEQLRDAGAGRLQREFEQLKARLATEGLFAPDAKKALPTWPAHVAVITSATGAALQDFLTVFRRRCPATLISLLPCPVQGEEAAPSICRALSLLDRHAAQLEPPVQVVVLTRGGGSLEDLWPFNTEAVARAIHACRLPVVSAVGHETDLSIADLAADQRAPTPSAAAELLSPDRELLLERFDGLRGELLRATQRRLIAMQQRLEWLRRCLRHPASTLREQAQRLDEIEQRMHAAMRQRLALERQRQAVLRTRLKGLHPGTALRAAERALATLSQRAQRAMVTGLAAQRRRLQSRAQLLDAVSPVATLARGYAIVTDADGRVLRDSSSVETGASVHARLARGRLHCRVERSEGPAPSDDADQ